MDRYSYFNDGAYIDITVRRNTGGNLPFVEVLNSMRLKTDGGGWDYTQVSEDRQVVDWKGGETGYYTKLKVPGSNSVFYGIRQIGLGTAVGTTRTVGFNVGDNRKIDLELVPKADIPAGVYTVTIQSKQQTSPTTGVIQGEAITYTFTVE